MRFTNEKYLQGKKDNKKIVFEKLANCSFFEYFLYDTILF